MKDVFFLLFVQLLFVTCLSRESKFSRKGNCLSAIGKKVSKLRFEVLAMVTSEKEEVD